VAYLIETVKALDGYPWMLVTFTSMDPWMSWRVFLVVVLAWEGNSDLGE
jgi:hypothetical protein